MIDIKLTVMMTVKFMSPLQPMTPRRRRTCAAGVGDEQQSGTVQLCCNVTTGRIFGRRCYDRG